jgi:hypothetical protein
MISDADKDILAAEVEKSVEKMAAAGDEEAEDEAAGDEDDE